MSAQLGLEAIAFDLDDTLVESTRAIYLWQDELVLEHDLGEPGRQFLREQQASPDPPSVTFHKIVTQFDLSDTAAELRAAFMERWPDLVEPVEGAMDVLAELRDRGWLLGLVTNGPEGLQTAKMGPEMLSLFDAVSFAGGDVPAKPDPQPFRHLSQELGVDPAACWMVGDSLSFDVEGARRVGMRPIWLTTGSEAGSETTLDTAVALTDVLDLVGRPHTARRLVPADSRADG